jgi:CheY-like chemotaxis protein
LPEVPIIILTGDGIQSDSSSHALETGANEVMVKPLNRLELASNLVILLQDAKTILIVNEDQYQLSSYRHIVSKEGYKVVAKSNPADAIRFVWNAKELSAILVDYNLSGMTCFEFTKAIRDFERINQAAHSLPIFVCSSASDQSTRT